MSAAFEFVDARLMCATCIEDIVAQLQEARASCNAESLSSSAVAESLDAKDQLSIFRDQFYIPQHDSADVGRACCDASLMTLGCASTVYIPLWQLVGSPAPQYGRIR